MEWQGPFLWLRGLSIPFPPHHPPRLPPLVCQKPLEDFDLAMSESFMILALVSYFFLLNGIDRQDLGFPQTFPSLCGASAGFMRERRCPRPPLPVERTVQSINSRRLQTKPRTPRCADFLTYTSGGLTDFPLFPRLNMPSEDLQSAGSSRVCFIFKVPLPPH